MRALCRPFTMGVGDTATPPNQHNHLWVRPVHRAKKEQQTRNG
jgi:hypothetical protein